MTAIGCDEVAVLARLIGLDVAADDLDAVAVSLERLLEVAETFEAP